MISLYWWQLVLIIYAWGLFGFTIIGIDIAKKELTDVPAYIALLILSIFYPITLIAMIIAGIKSKIRPKKELTLNDIFETLNDKYQECGEEQKEKEEQ